MKAQIKIFLILLLIFGWKQVTPQLGTVLVMNADTENKDQTVFVKWFIDEVYCEEGVDIYRKREGESNWKKITSEPYKYIRPISSEDYEEDKSLKEYTGIIDKTPKHELKSIILLNVLLKAIESDIYAKYLGLLYEDNTAVLGETYTYKVMKLEKGIEKLIGISSEIKTGDFTAESPLQDIKVTAGIHKADMIWKPELQRYYAIDIFRSSSLNAEEIQLNDLPIMLSQKVDEDGSMTIPEPYFSDDSLTNGVTYHYRLRATDYFGRKTNMSDTVSVLIKDLIPPLPPYNVRAEQDNLKTVLKWQNDTSSDLHGMYVYRSTNDTDYIKINEALLSKTDTSYLDIAKRSGTYFYYITANDAGNNEARSPKIMVEIPDIIPPEKPAGLIAKADTGKIHLSWAPNTDGDLMGYIVYRRIAAKKNMEFAPVFADPVSNNTFTDQLSKVSKNYFEYVVAAVDSSFNVSEHSNIASAQMPDVLAPHKPRFKKTWLSDVGVVVEWVPNREPDLMGYNIFRKEKEDTISYMKLNKEILSPSLYQYTDADTESGKVYYYRLSAVDSAGNVSPLSVSFLGAIKKPETGDSSVLKKISVTYNKKKSTVRIKWKVSEETNYKGSVVYRKEEGKTFRPITALLKDHEYFDVDIEENITYNYQVRLYESNGKVIKSEVYEIAVEK